MTLKTALPAQSRTLANFANRITTGMSTWGNAAQSVADSTSTRTMPLSQPAASTVQKTAHSATTATARHVAPDTSLIMRLDSATRWRVSHQQNYNMWCAHTPRASLSSSSLTQSAYLRIHSTSGHSHSQKFIILQEQIQRLVRLFTSQKEHTLTISAMF